MKKIAGLLTLVLIFAVITVPASGSEREDFFSSEGRKFWSLGVNLGTSFATPLIIANFNFTIAPLPNSFFEFGIDGGFLNGMAGENTPVGSMEYTSTYLYARANLFFPLGKREFDSYGKPREAGGMYFGFGVGHMAAQYSFVQSSKESHVATINTPTFDGAAGFIIGKGRILFRAGYAVRTTMDMKNIIGVNHRLMLGVTYRIY
ncbi:MAG: hypothetical protein LBU88_06075 [Treponema sp.]|jgi:hypothetical protein|nr:hypothetical protein [Treponema sp.]